MIDGRSLLRFPDKMSQSTIDDCLRVFEPSPFWSSLPCRENEIEYVHEFISSAFNSKDPKTLHLSGRPCTGKTSVVSLCAMMSMHMQNIEFLNIEEWLNGQYEIKPNKIRRLIVIDLPPHHLIPELFNFFIPLNYSIILITQDARINLPQFDMFFSTKINFSSYDKNQITYILIDKLRCVSDAIDAGTIDYIAQMTFMKGYGLEGAITLLVNALQTAKAQEKHTLDKETVQDTYYNLTEDPVVTENEDIYNRYEITITG